MAKRAFRSGSAVSDTREIISFWGYAQTNYFFTFRRTGASSGYQVPVGNVLVITRLLIRQDPNGQNSFHFLYGTSDVGFNSASGPTGNVSLVGDQSSLVYSPFITYSAQLNYTWPLDVSVLLPIPATYYPGAKVVNYSNSIYIEGYLETV